MRIKDKIKNAKLTDWLSDGLTDKKIKKIKEVAIKKANKQLKRKED
jgi:hypothetical protein